MHKTVCDTYASAHRSRVKEHDARQLEIFNEKKGNYSVVTFEERFSKQSLYTIYVPDTSDPSDPAEKQSFP